MSKVQLELLLRDVIPTFQGPIPLQLVKFVESLHLLSLQKQPILPNKADVGRMHICAYLGAEKYQERFSLPEASLRKVPLQPKIVDKILDDFRVNLLDGIRSPSSTPFSTPTKNRVSPTKALTSQNAPQISSPLKRLHALETPENDQKRPRLLADVESPFNPKNGSSSLNDEASPFNPKGSKEGSPKKVLVSRYQKRLTVADFISFCNNFYIPSTTTPLMVEAFLAQKHKFAKKSEWLLACGLVHAAYIRVNHQILGSKMGAKNKFQDQLFQYQKGGLMKRMMVMWINVVEDAVKHESWIRDLERKFVYRDGANEGSSHKAEIAAKLGKGWDIIEAIGGMVDASVMYDSQSQKEYYERWTGRVKEALEE